MPILRLLLPLCLLLALSWPTAVRAQQGAQGIVAVVNDDIVTTQQLDDRLRLALITSGLPDDPETRRRIAAQVLRSIVDELLQRQEARRLGIEVSGDELARAVQEIAQRNNMSVGTLDAFLQSRGVTLDMMRDQLRSQIAWLKLVGREIRPKVVVTQEQIDLAIRAAANSASAGELLMGEILLPVESPSQEPEVLRDATELVAALRQGAAFGPLASQVSVAASADQGGDLGWVRVSTLIPELRDILLKMPRGAISDPIRSPDGIYIFQLRDRRGALPVAEPEPPAPTPQRQAQPRQQPITPAGSVTLAQLLFPLPERATQAQTEAALRQASAIRPQLGSCDALEQVATQLRAEQSGVLGKLRVADLPPVLANTIMTLETGTISDPIRGPAGIHLLMVCDRDTPPVRVASPPPPPPPAPVAAATPAAPAAAETREQVRERLVEEQTQRLSNRYMRNLRRNAFIDLRA